MPHSAGLSSRYAVALFTVFVFMVAISAPCVANIFSLSQDESLQDAEPNAMPEFKADFTVISQIIYKLRRNWLEKNFTLRSRLVRWQSMLDVAVLKSSSHFDVVFSANDKWLYLSQENPMLNVINDWRGTELLTRADLEKWAAVFAQRKAWLAERGIAYLVVVAPNKVSIYPEHLPAYLNRMRDITKLDQMVEALQTAGVEVLDLRPCLLMAKEHMLSYYRTDSHWTPYGAFQAYTTLAEKLGERFAGIRPLSLDDFTVTQEPGLSGGLAFMIALGDMFLEDKIVFTPKIPRTAKEVAGNPVAINQFQPLVVLETGNPALPRALVIRDSFVHELIPFLSEHFSRVLYTWPLPSDVTQVRNFDQALIESEKPNVVIDEFVERYFTQRPPLSSPKAER